MYTQQTLLHMLLAVKLWRHLSLGKDKVCTSVRQNKHPNPASAEVAKNM